MTLASFGAAAAGIVHLSRSTGWGAGHVAAVAAAPLLVRAVLAFTYDPLVGEVSASAKYGHNVVMLLIVLLAVALTSSRWRSYAAGRRGSRSPGVSEGCALR